jgi:dsDNA-specific endonuclease/ATPase MutS2
MEKVARVDLQVSRIRAAETWQGTKPEWAREELEIRGGFHPAVANLCKEQGREITIIDCTLRRGVTVLFGPNMGGKTVALKTIGLIVFLAQWGFFVPAASCRMPLFSWVASLIGDQQEIKRNLSSFGAEVVRLKDWIERSEAGLLLLDEIGRGTNPVEGSALAQAVTCHLVHAPHYTVHVTHYQEVLKIDGIAGYRVAGFSRPDDRGVWEQVKWEKLLQELMDYRLIPYRQGESIPHEALWIAERLGLCPQVIADAKRRVRGEDRKWKQN